MKKDMDKQRKIRAVTGFALLVVAAVILFILSLASGSSRISADTVFDVLTGHNAD